MQARRHLTHGTALEIAELELVEVIHDPRTEREIDPVRSIDEKVGSEGREGGICKGDDDKQNA